MIVLLIMQLSVLRDSRGRIESQDRKIAILLEESGPLITSSKPLVEQATAAIEPLTRNGRQLAAAAATLPRVEATGRAVAGEAIPLLGQLRATDLPDLARRARAALDLAPRLADILRVSLKVQRDTRSLQTRALVALEESLAVQRETLGRAISIERRLRSLPAAPTP